MLASFKPLLGLAAAAFATTAFGGVDLTPAPREIVEEGIRFKQLSFKAEGGTVLLVPPQDWTFRGGTNRLQLTPPEKAFAEGSLEAAPLPELRPIDEIAIAAFKQEVLATLPPGSQKIEIVQEAANALMPAGYPSFEVIFSYALMGKTFQRSALLVHAPKDRLVFRLTAVTQDFTALSAAFRRCIMSWQFGETSPAAMDGGTSPAAGNSSQLLAAAN